LWLVEFVRYTACMGKNLDKPPKRRRWLQFRLRTLLLLTTVVCVALGWLNHERRSIAARREAMEKMGAQLEDVGPQPEWRVWLLGDDSPRYAQTISLMHLSVSSADVVHFEGLSVLQRLSLGGTHVTDSGVERLAGLTQLKTLILYDTSISDAGLAHLEKLRKVEQLSLAGTSVSGAGLLHLKGMTRLKILYLDNTKVSGADLVHLKDFSLLKHLGLGYLGITDADLVHLQGLSRLQCLGLDGFHGTGAGFEQLKNLKQLDYLVLNLAALDDAGLEHIEEFMQLRYLFIGSTHVTDAGVPSLKRLSKLEYLDLRNTKVTDKGLAELDQAFPNATIEHSSSTFLNAKQKKEMADCLKQIEADMPILLKSLRNAEPAIRERIARELGDFNSPTAVPALTEALKDENQFVRLQAAESLGRIGPEAKTAIPALTAAVKNFDQDAPLAYEADRALQKLTPGTASMLEGK
jgi:Leucine-rich repeat (LRR) protein